MLTNWQTGLPEERRLLRRWLLVLTGGWLVGVLATDLVTVAYGLALDVFSGARTAASEGMFQTGEVAVHFLCLGVAQWLVLRRLLWGQRVRWWPAATAVGVLLGFAALLLLRAPVSLSHAGSVAPVSIAMLLPRVAWAPVTLLLFGIVVGAVQGVSLGMEERPQTAVVLAWASGTAVGLLFARVLRFSLIGSVLGAAPGAEISGLALVGLFELLQALISGFVFAAATGTVVLWYARRVSPWGGVQRRRRLRERRRQRRQAI